MWDSKSFLKEVYRRTNLNYVGHNWMHTNMSIKEMIIRMEMEHKKTVSSIDLNIIKILSAIETTCEENVDTIVEWLNDGNSDRYNMRKDFRHEFAKPIGKMITNEYICNFNTGIPCKVFVVVLQKTKMSSDGSFGFTFKTEYCDITLNEKKILKIEAE